MRNNRNQTGGRLQLGLWEGLEIYIRNAPFGEKGIYYHERFEDLEL